MSDVINLMRNVSKMNDSPLLSGYSKVIINLGVDDDGNAMTIESGSEGGAVLTVNNPWGSQEMADKILERIQGWQYQPFSAEAALLDPSGELGDGITINNTYSGIYKRTTEFGRLMLSDISAPADREIEHELTAGSVSATDRAYTRVVKSMNARISQTAAQIQLEAQIRETEDSELTAQLNIHSSEISAKVSKKSGTEGSSSFGWKLDSGSWTLFNGSDIILKATENGLEVKGKITAESGSIGGFSIERDYLSYGGLSWTGSASNGIYIGTSGIKLGKNFSVDTGGNVTAKDMTLSGTLNIGGEDISASTLRSGAQSAYTNGSYWSGGASHGYNYDANFKYNPVLGDIEYVGGSKCLNANRIRINTAVIAGSFGFKTNASDTVDSYAALGRKLSYLANKSAAWSWLPDGNGNHHYILTGGGT